MTDGQDLATTFVSLRSKLASIAYTIIGSAAQAEDVVQEAWIRLQKHGDAVDHIEGWLVTVVVRLSLDALRTARRAREAYVGLWLPEPIDVERNGDAQRRLEVSEAVSLALMFVLERLSPAERSSFLLHDVFGFEFEEVGRMTGRSSAAARQLATRARGRIRSEAPRRPPSEEEHRRVVGAFLAACEAGSRGELLRLLDGAVVLRADDGGRGVAAVHPVVGAAEVAQRILTIEPSLVAAGGSARVASINFAPAVVCERAGKVHAVLSLELDGGLISAIAVVASAAKLRYVRAANAPRKEMLS